MKRFLRLSLLFLTLFMGQSMAGIFNPQVRILPNGLKVIVVSNDMAPIVSVGVLYMVGTADDPPNLIGISHFLEHMMFKGTKTVPTSDFTKTILAYGGSTNASTNFDYTLYNTDIAKEHLELVLKFEADRMVNLAFSETEVKSEKDVVWEERRMRFDNHPFGQAYEVLLRTLSWYHPYGVPPIGYPAHIRNYSYEALRAHYHTWYAPNNAVLIVAGKTTIDEVMKLAEKHFGSLSAKKIPERVREAEPPHLGITQHIEQKNSRNSLILLNWYYQAPNHKGEGKEHYYPLTVLAQILGGNSTTDFYRAFVEEKKLAIGVNANYEGDSFDPRSFCISAVLAPHMNVQVFKNELAAYFQNILEKGVGEEELRKAKRDLLAQLAFIRDGNNTTLTVFTGLACGFSVEEIEKWGEYIELVTLEQVHAAAKLVLGALPIVTMDLYPEK
jgi:zinc protease